MRQEIACNTDSLDFCKMLVKAGYTPEKYQHGKQRDQACVSILLDLPGIFQEHAFLVSVGFNICNAFFFLISNTNDLAGSQLSSSMLRREIFEKMEANMVLVTNKRQIRLYWPNLVWVEEKQ